MMLWNDILTNREQVFLFDDAKPEFLLIQNVVAEMHSYMPVKQNKLLFNLTVIDNTIDYEKKMIIYSSTRTSNSKYYRYNTQALAPYLFLFSVKSNITYPNPGYALHMKNEALMQIGMAAMFINFAAINQKLSIGFCRCINPTYEFRKIYDNIELIIGAGYKSSSTTYCCPITNITYNIPLKNEKKCPEKEYIFYENTQIV
jgi:hypothetical protein